MTCIVFYMLAAFVFRVSFSFLVVIFFAQAYILFASSLYYMLYAE